MKKASIVSILLLLSAFTLSACETVEGFGRDLEKAGDAISKEANKSK